MKGGETLNGRIKQERAALGLSQKALAKEVGVSNNTITRWEKDASCVKQNHLIKMSHLFNCSVSWLVGESDTRGVAIGS